MRFIIADEKLSQAENMRNLVKNAFPNDETEIYCEKNKVISDLLNNCGGVLFLHFSEKNCWGYELAAELKRLNIRVNVVFLPIFPTLPQMRFRFMPRIILYLQRNSGFMKLLKISVTP